MSFRLPKSGELVGIPAALVLAYNVSYSTADIFTSLRASLPVVRHLAPVLFYVHVLESLLAGYRSRAHNQALPDTIKWMLATVRHLHVFKPHTYSQNVVHLGFRESWAAEENSSGQETLSVSADTRIYRDFLE